jgi:hypothetical protein
MKIDTNLTPDFGIFADVGVSRAVAKSLSEADPGEWAELSVCDDGPGGLHSESEEAYRVADTAGISCPVAGSSTYVGARHQGRPRLLAEYVEPRNCRHIYHCFVHRYL